MILPKGSILKVSELSTPEPENRHGLTEENRSEVDVSFERIGSKSRMANARMRGWYVADKRTWSVSWNMVPHSSAFTLDGKWGGSEITDWFENHPDDFYLFVRKPDSTDEQFRVLFDSFSSRVQKRGKYEFWNVSLTLVEV